MFMSCLYKTLETRQRARVYSIISPTCRCGGEATGAVYEPVQRKIYVYTCAQMGKGAKKLWSDIPYIYISRWFISVVLAFPARLRPTGYNNDIIMYMWTRGICSNTVHIIIIKYWWRPESEGRITSSPSSSSPAVYPRVHIKLFFQGRTGPLILADDDDDDDDDEALKQQLLLFSCVLSVFLCKTVATCVSGKTTLSPGITCP